MTQAGKTVTIFTLPQQFPCGPRSSCCGPVGQSAAEVEKLKGAIEKKLECRVVVLDLDQPASVVGYDKVKRLLGSFGAAASPIIMVGEEVVSMGSSAPEEALAALREHMRGA